MARQRRRVIWSGRYLTEAAFLPGLILASALSCAGPPGVETAPRSGWAPPWPLLRGPYLGQPLPGDTPEIFADGIVALGNHEHHLAISPDGREMLWVIADKYRNRHTLIRVAERDGVWLSPEVAPFSGRDNDFAPSFFPDGSALLFCSNRPLPGTDEPTPDANIWTVERTPDGWGEPRPLPSPVNDGSSEYNPSITSDGLLVFQDHDDGGADLYTTRFAEGAWQPPEKIRGAVNSPSAEITPFVSGDGRLLVFASDRPGGLGSLDLYASRRLPDGGWADPVNLGPSVNTDAADAVPTLSPDNRMLFLTSFAGFASADFRDRSYEELVRMLRSARNGDGTLYWVSGALLDEAVADQPTQATVPMTLDHNRMLVDGEFPDQDGSWQHARLWVDSGNPDLLLSEGLARRLGLDLSRAPADVVDGKLEVPTPAGLRLDGFPLDLESVKTYVLFEPRWLFGTMHNDANLPSTVLRRYQVVFDYPARTLTMAEPGSLQPRGVAVPASVHPRTGIVQMDAVIAGERFSFALDNGASYSFTSARVLERLVRQHPDWPTMRGALGHANIWGWWPREEAWHVTRVPEIRWGEVALSQVGLVGLGEIFGEGFDLGAWYSEKTARPVDGFLGPNAFEAFRVEIDFPHSTVYFERGPTPVTLDMDIVGLTLRPELDGGYSVLGVAEQDGQTAVPGVEPGDRLLRVDDLDTAGATMGTVVDALRGEPGAVRTLVLERDGRRWTVAARVERFLAPAR